MKSDIWLNKGYKKGYETEITQKISYHIWTNQNDEPIGVTIDFEYANDVHYELNYEDWILFLQKLLHITVPSAFDEVLRNSFSKADYLSFEEELTKNEIEFSKIVYY
ncbi:hypothetical protein HBE96_10005 [Clostridium sp. P21]|uniref:Uncharacterized protein n=1 Tax=Clostridium muellerianum TaxID=2716538 RepID=A0A7Y0EGH4_9CLOT|nr:hypothetical protein [Clostridium muellerianum]NMM63028.1 hypothetical protein [Clostridium muellerianum]